MDFYVFMDGRFKPINGKHVHQFRPAGFAILPF